jgi:hypothetical protein
MADGEVQQPEFSRRRRRSLRIFPYAVNRSRLERAIQTCRVPASLVDDLHQADLVLTLKSHEKHQPKRLYEAQARGVPLHVIRNNTATQMEQFLRTIFDKREPRWGQRAMDEAALREVEVAIHEVMEQARPVELSPQNTYVRRLQHQLVERYGLSTESKGSDPYRRVVIYPL